MYICNILFVKKFQIVFPDTGKDHVSVFTPKDFLTPTYLEGIILPQVIFIIVHNLYFCVHTSYERDTHTDISLDIYRFM